MRTIKSTRFKIAEGTIFIILDLEWNQPFIGKDYGFDVSTLKGDIIDIGAEKYIFSNGEFKYLGGLSKAVRPDTYRKLHYHVQKLTNKTNREIKQGASFKDAFKEYKEFCGDNYILVGWGNSDPEILKQNMKFYGYDNTIGMPFLDLQPIFSSFAGEQSKQRSVEYAVDFYSIPKDDTFHSAWADSHYTGLIFKAIFDNNETSDVLSMVETSVCDPDVVNDFSFVSTECDSFELAVEASSKFPRVCPFCEEAFQVVTKAFRIRKSLYAHYRCEEHGDYYCRIRIKKSKRNKQYAAMLLRFATQADLGLLAEKIEEYNEFGEEGRPAVKIVPNSVDENADTNSDSEG